MKKVLILASFLMSCTAASSQQSSRIKVGNIFKDVSEISGYSSQSSTAVNLHYGVNHIKSHKNEHYLISSKFEDGHLGTNDYQMRVIDIVEIPPFKEEYFRVKLKNCSLNGRNNSSLFALVVSEEKRQLKNVLRVWTLDRKTGVLTSVNPEGVTCFNENWVAYSGN
ncbi:MAG: hypothetical protein NWP83_07515 [Spirosomaceae bacterium]|nr:hypothetical protein [Spirosomataceae bacterium]